MPDNLLTITINATCIEHAQELLAVRSMPAALPAPEATNELLADLKAAEFALKDEKQAREDLWGDLKATERERDEARAAMLQAKEAREDALQAADRLGATLDTVAAVVGFGPERLVADLADHINRVLEIAAKRVADAGADVTRLRDENKALALEVKRLSDALGTTPPPAAPERQPLPIGTQVWLGEVGSAEAGTVAEWRVEEDGTFAYGIALDGKAELVWACEGDGDFHTERPKRKRRTKAEIDAERDAMNTLTPGTVMLATIDGEQVQASIVRRFDGTTKYEVQVLAEGRGLAVVEAADLAPLLDLRDEHEFPDERVSDGPHDDPLVDDEQYAEVKTMLQALGLSVAEVKAITKKHFGTESGRELRVSQARQLVDVILPGQVNTPEALPF